MLLAHNSVLVAHHGLDRLFSYGRRRPSLEAGADASFTRRYLRNIRKHHSTPQRVFSIYACLWAADLVHALAHYAILESAGAVAVALSRGVQMLLVVGLSALVFCDADPAQCATPLKVVSVSNVAVGIAFYARGAARARARRKLQPAGAAADRS